jgi:hypothetical protein
MKLNFFRQNGNPINTTDQVSDFIAESDDQDGANFFVKTVYEYIKLCMY